MYRAQEKAILADLEKKMVFLTGPRQVGKTYLSQQLANHFDETLYLNYDNLDHRKVIEDRSWLVPLDLLILDEIHKMPNWKNFIKGIYDTRPKSMRMLITGSARLESFRGTGDSLAGRFYRHQLLPLTCNELKDPQALHSLMALGEFPEPFLSNDLTTSQRWRMQYIDGLIREDILDFEKIHDFKKIQLTLRLLQRGVGSPVSYTSIAQDVDASVNTVKRYIEIFEALYIIFRVTPFSKHIARSLLKQPKIYFYDTGLVNSDAGAKLENHVALSLLKDLSIFSESQGITAALHYLRTKDGREIDFCRVVNDEILDAIEVKVKDTKPTAAARYFSKRYAFKIRQILQHLDTEHMAQRIEILNAAKFLTQGSTKQLSAYANQDS